MEVCAKLKENKGCGHSMETMQNVQRELLSSKEEFKAQHAPPEAEVNSSVESPLPFNDELDRHKKFESDKNKLLGLLCEEIWFLVFEKVDHPSQLELLSNASLFFRDLLSSQRTDFLFHNVFRVLHNNPGKTSSNYSMNRMLEFRLVCRSWCKAIDDVFQNDPDNYTIRLYHEGSSSTQVLNRVQAKLLLHVGNEYTCPDRRWRSFLQHFLQTHDTAGRNPLIGRRMRLDLTMHDDKGSIVALQNILKKYGHHIWHCDIVIICFDIVRQITLESALYSRLREILCWMPNLRTLCIENWHGFETTANGQPERPSNPYPTLMNLQMLKTVYVAPCIFAELVSRNPQLIALDVFRQSKPPQEEQFQLRNLSTLVVNFDSDDNFITDPRLTSSPVTKLYVRCSNCSSFQWQKLYRVLENKYKNTLTFLKVDLPNVEEAHKDKIFPNGNIYTLDLPHLTHVELHLRNVVCMDFLLPMKDTLTSLHVTLLLCVTLLTHLDHQEMIEGGANPLNSFNCGRWPLTSNVWNIFPKLKSIHFKYSDPVHSFSRSCSRLEWKTKMMGKR